MILTAHPKTIPCGIPANFAVYNASNRCDLRSYVDVKVSSDYDLGRAIKQSLLGGCAPEAVKRFIDGVKNRGAACERFPLGAFHDA